MGSLSSDPGSFHDVGLIPRLLYEVGCVKREMLTFQVSRFNQVQRKKPFLENRILAGGITFALVLPSQLVVSQEENPTSSSSSICHSCLLSLPSSGHWTSPCDLIRGHVLSRTTVLCGPFDSVLLPLQVYCGCLK